MRTLLIAAALALAPVAALAQQPRESLPPSVRAQLAQDLQTCRAAGQTWTPPNDYVQSGDFNGDGRADFLIARSAAQCGVAFCAPDGCQFDTFISQSGGSYQRAYGMTEGQGTVRIAPGAGRRDVIERSSGARLAWNGQDWVAGR